ncbi:multifunctional acyl-CoA thioesterase I and protease I and lysophospholipase L1 [compost metagenome]
MLSKKDHYNIVLFGDSIAKGVILDNENGKYKVLSNSFANLVQNQFKGIIHNAGRFGSVITKGFSTMYRDVLSKKPDIVILEFGGNDCDYNWEEIAENPHGDYLPKTTLNRYVSTLKEMIEKLRQEKIVPVLMTLPPLDAERYFKWISKNSSSKASNILAWLGTVNEIYDWHKLYNDAIIEVAKELKVKWIDIRDAFMKTEDYRKYMCEDGIHPNEQGHELIADYFIRFIKNNHHELLKSV